MPSESWWRQMCKSTADTSFIGWSLSTKFQGTFIDICFWIIWNLHSLLRGRQKGNGTLKRPAKTSEGQYYSKYFIKLRVTALLRLEVGMPRITVTMFGLMPATFLNVKKVPQSHIGPAQTNTEPCYQAVRWRIWSRVALTDYSKSEMPGTRNVIRAD